MRSASLAINLKAITARGYVHGILTFLGSCGGRIVTFCAAFIQLPQQARAVGCHLLKRVRGLRRG